MKFTYSSGQRPLSGYTLKRGIGRGGFGEVYFALSDGGKEVALKLLRGNGEVELRGVAQCLNLKHANLVSLYDLRTDAAGDTWVVMEYIAGEPLSVVLTRHPRGLPPELAQQWFLALARAVAYLHDHGIVHRDLKPGNIFLENGTLKVGDYGLCKFISGSQATRQSQSVGTVHYMAPEISTGNYNKTIDVYAAGVILYEMLTGRVPFDGESAGEILMKHLTAPPDLSKVPAEYAPVLARALSKNPAHRYQSMAEMARAVEAVGTEERRAATRPPHPQPLSPQGRGEKAWRPACSMKPDLSPQGRGEKERNPLAPLGRGAGVRGLAPAAPAAEHIPTVLPVVTWRERVVELTGSLLLAAVFAGLGTVLWTALAVTLSGPAVRGWPFTDVSTFFFLTLAVCWAVLIPAKFWGSRRGDSWLRRLVMLVLGAGIGLGALWLQGWLPRLPDGGYLRTGMPPSVLFPDGGLADVAAYLSYFGLVFFALRWWRLADPRRGQRFSFVPILVAGFWSLILLLVWPQPMRGAVALVLASAIVQLVSPWEPAPPPAPRRARLRYGCCN